TLRQPGTQLEVLIAADERIEQQRVNALRLRVDSDSGVEIRGAALDDHHQRMGIGGLRAAHSEYQPACCHHAQCHPERARSEFCEASANERLTHFRYT